MENMVKFVICMENMVKFVWRTGCSLYGEHGEVCMENMVKVVW